MSGFNAQAQQALRFLWKHKGGTVVISGVVTITSFKKWANRVGYQKKETAAIRHWREESRKPIDVTQIPTRMEQIERMWKQGTVNDPLDILVIGGGATGSGVALDACTRGLRVALVEKEDFGSGTSGRSTKLIHGGVRYLERAILQLDRSQWELVEEAIAERAHLIDINPHLSYPIPIIIPVYDEFYIRGMFNLVKYLIGCKIYEGMAGRMGMLAPSYMLSAAHSRIAFPQLKQQSLVGSIVYYDGQHNDARMNALIALTGASKGAIVANHVEVVDLIKDESTDQVVGARLRDTLSGFEWNTFAKVVVNATGPYVDAVRRMDDLYATALIRPSQGSHLVLPRTFTPPNKGMLVPKTKDGRVAFLLPWEGATLCGTTDRELTHDEMEQLDQNRCHPTISEAEDILSYVNEYLETPADLSDVDAAWAGIRPLACIPPDYCTSIAGVNSKEYKAMICAPSTSREERRLAALSGADKKGGNVDTSKVSRQHLIEVNPDSGLLTITGGKWTTYRQMAEDVVSVVCELHPDIGRRAAECVTQVVKLLGSQNWNQSVTAILERHQIPSDIASYLSRNYGDRAFVIGDLYLEEKYSGKRLAGGFPHTEAEVVYCCRYEMAQTAIDVLSNRTRLALLSRSAAEYALPRVIAVMGEVHEWDTRTRVAQYHEASAFIQTMHVSERHKWGRHRHTVDYARRVVESVLDGPSMTDEAIEFVINRFIHFYEENTRPMDTPPPTRVREDDDDDEYYDDLETQDAAEYMERKEKEGRRRELFEGCISRAQARQLVEDFAQVFGDDRVVDACMFTGMERLGLYDILVSCAGCAADPEQFDPVGPWLIQ